METKVLDGQSTLDIAIQTGGSIDAVFDLAIKNNISITDYLTPNQVLVNPEVSNAQVLTYYQMKALRPATGIAETGEGIESWAIEYDFVVS